jgi:transcriptional regulator with XRE-family HTH domain
MDVRGLGEYIRRQRETSRLSLRNLAKITGISGTYLSQVERGLRKPSAEIMQGIAKGLRVSAETLYVQAGILEDRPVADVTSAILSDLTLTERQKQALVQIYEAFREETRRAASEGSQADRAPSNGGPKRSTKRPSAGAVSRPSTAASKSRTTGATSAPRARVRAAARQTKEA